MSLIGVFVAAICVLFEMGLPLHVMGTSVSLCTDTPSFVNTEIVPSSDILPTLINDVGNCSKVLACVAFAESWWNGSFVTFVALLTSPFATRTCFANLRNMGIPAFFLSVSLM